MISAYGAPSPSIRERTGPPCRAETTPGHANHGRDAKHSVQPLSAPSKTPPPPDQNSNSATTSADRQALIGPARPAANAYSTLAACAASPIQAASVASPNRVANAIQA